MVYGQTGIHSWSDFITTVGVPTALLFVILWFVRAWLNKYQEESVQREVRMADRIGKLEDFQNTILVDLVSECKSALIQNTTAINELHRCVLESNTEVSQLVHKMLERPCLLPEEKT